MPEYIYQCEEGHQTNAVHGMQENPVIYCQTCGAVMRRRPQSTRVNWQGRPPSQGGISQPIQNLIDNAPRGRDEFAERHAKHERATSDR